MSDEKKTPAERVSESVSRAIPEDPPDTNKTLLGNDKRDPLMMVDVPAQFADKVQLEAVPGAMRLIFGQRVGQNKILPVGGIVMTMQDFAQLLQHGNSFLNAMRPRAMPAAPTEAAPAGAGAGSGPAVASN